MNRIKLLSIRTKLFVLFLTVLIAAFSVLYYEQFLIVTKVIENEAQEKAKSDLGMSIKIIDLQLPGSWNIVDNKLYKGDTLMNGNEEIIDMIGEVTNGDTVTIFQGDMRVATNVLLQDGARAVGTKVSEEVAQTVLKEGQMFYGSANVVGNSYQAAYMPLNNDKGETIGIFYVGAPDANDRIQVLKYDIFLRLLLVVVITLVVAFGLIHVFTRTGIKRLRNTVNILESVADGDLTAEVPEVKSKDEIGQLQVATSHMLRELRLLITKAAEASEYVSTASNQLIQSTEYTTSAAEQISKEIQEVSLGADRQKESLASANVSIHEIAIGMQQTAMVIQDMAEFAIAVNQNASDGTQIVTNTINQMNVIHETVEQASGVIQQLHDKSAQINQIITVITDMANQTHLLALNAAIEAARAGEHGAGFSVVAQEVRKLSDQSLHSAENIRELIEVVQQEAENAVRSMHHGTQVVEQGLTYMGQSNAVFNEIVGALGNLSAQSQEISAIVQQVHANTDEMVNVMDQIGEITEAATQRSQIVTTEIEEQTSCMEEVSTASLQLGNMSSELRGLIEKFKTH